MTMGEVILTMKDIDKSFPGVHALITLISK